MKTKIDKIESKTTEYVSIFEDAFEQEKQLRLKGEDK